jgi:hypothetical protein
MGGPSALTKGLAYSDQCHFHAARLSPALHKAPPVYQVIILPQQGVLICFLSNYPLDHNNGANTAKLLLPSLPTVRPDASSRTVTTTHYKLTAPPETASGHVYELQASSAKTPLYYHKRSGNNSLPLAQGQGKHQTIEQGLLYNRLLLKRTTLFSLRKSHHQQQSLPATKPKASARQPQAMASCYRPPSKMTTLFNENQQQHPQQQSLPLHRAQGICRTTSGHGIVLQAAVQDDYAVQRELAAAAAPIPPSPQNPRHLPDNLKPWHRATGRRPR